MPRLVRLPSDSHCRQLGVTNTQSMKDCGPTFNETCTPLTATEARTHFGEPQDWRTRSEAATGRDAVPRAPIRQVRGRLSQALSSSALISRTQRSSHCTGEPSPIATRLPSIKTGPASVAHSSPRPASSPRSRRAIGCPTSRVSGHAGCRGSSRSPAGMRAIARWRCCS